MKISDTVRALLNICGKKQSDLIDVLGKASKQSLNNKFAYDRWDGKDLIKVADALGCRIGFQLPSGDMIYLDPSEYVGGEDQPEK